MVETGLLCIEKAGAQIDGGLAHGIFRAVHSVKGGAGILGLETIGGLAHHTENALTLVRNGKMVPTRDA